MGKSGSKEEADQHEILEMDDRTVKGILSLVLVLYDNHLVTSSNQMFVVEKRTRTTNPMMWPVENFKLLSYQPKCCLAQGRAQY